MQLPTPVQEELKRAKPGDGHQESEEENSCQGQFYCQDTPPQKKKIQICLIIDQIWSINSVLIY